MILYKSICASDLCACVRACVSLSHQVVSLVCEVRSFFFSCQHHCLQSLTIQGKYLQGKLPEAMLSTSIYLTMIRCVCVSGFECECCLCVRCVCVCVWMFLSGVWLCTAVWLMATGRGSRQGQLLLLWAILLNVPDMAEGWARSPLTILSPVYQQRRAFKQGLCIWCWHSCIQIAVAGEPAEQHNSINRL